MKSRCYKKEDRAEVARPDESRRGMCNVERCQENGDDLKKRIGRSSNLTAVCSYVRSSFFIFGTFSDFSMISYGKES